MTVDIFVFCGWGLSETHLSCDTVDRELWLAIYLAHCCALKWTGMFPQKAWLCVYFI